MKNKVPQIVPPVKHTSEQNDLSIWEIPSVRKDPLPQQSILIPGIMIIVVCLMIKMKIYIDENLTHESPQPPEDSKLLLDLQI